MPVEVVPTRRRGRWSSRSSQQTCDSHSLRCLPHESSTGGRRQVPRLAAKPILDIDVIVDGEEMRKAVAAMGSLRAQYPLGVVVNRPSVWPDR